jgi:hypothetical protein
MFNDVPLNSSAAGVFTFLPISTNTTLVVTYQSLAMGSQTFSYDNTTQYMKVVRRVVKLDFTGCLNTDEVSLTLGAETPQNILCVAFYLLLPA